MKLYFPRLKWTPAWHRATKKRHRRRQRSQLQRRRWLAMRLPSAQLSNHNSVACKFPPLMIDYNEYLQSPSTQSLSRLPNHIVAQSLCLCHCYPWVPPLSTRGQSQVGKYLKQSRNEWCTDCFTCIGFSVSPCWNSNECYKKICSVWLVVCCWCVFIRTKLLSLQSHQ